MSQIEAQSRTAGVDPIAAKVRWYPPVKVGARFAMRRTIGIVSIWLAAFGSVGAMPLHMTVDRLLDVCEARTVETAMSKGDELGWERLSEAETEEWRTSFVAFNGGSVDVVSWQRKLSDKDETLSFWIAVGPNAHKACAYTTNAPAGVLSALTQRLGEPDSLEESTAIDMISAWWTRVDQDYSFTQIGSSATVNIGPRH